MPIVTTALIYLVVMAVVATVVYLFAALVFGRGEELAPLPPGATPTRLPASDVRGADVRALRFQQVVRGYRMSEVDWVLDRLAGELDHLRQRVDELERELAAARGETAGAGAEHAEAERGTTDVSTEEGTTRPQERADEERPGDSTRRREV